MSLLLLHWRWGLVTHSFSSFEVLTPHKSLLAQHIHWFQKLSDNWYQKKKKKGTFMFWFRELNLTFMFHFLVKMGQKLHVVNCLGPLRLCWAFARKVLSSALFCNFHMVHLNLFTAAFTNSENVTVSNQSKYCLWFSYHIIFHDCLDNTNFHLYYWVLLISPVATCISLYSWSCLLLT